MEKREILNELLKWRYAHRGLHSKPEIPENSMTAFRRAVTEGFGIELDVHLTKDGKLAVIHDSSLRRTCGIDINIEDITLKEAQIYFLEKSNEVIPDLSEVLGAVEGRVPLIIEIKTAGKNHAELIDAVMKLLSEYEGLYCLESFNPVAVGYLKKSFPDVVRGQLAGHLRGEGEDEPQNSETEDKVRLPIDVDCVEFEDTGLEGTFMDESLSDKGGSEPKLSKTQDFLLRNLWVNIESRPDFVAYKYSDRNIKAFKKYDGAKFLWTIREYSELLECEKLGAAGIFEQFNPKDYE